MAPAHSFVEITDPETGHLITVARRLDPVGRLYASGNIASYQRAALAAYQADTEALSGSLRAPSCGPSDISWRGRRPSYNKELSKRASDVAKALTTDQKTAVHAALAGNRTDVRILNQALDAIASVYGLSTKPTTH
jgi:hypothetical protein